MRIKKGNDVKPMIIPDIHLAFGNGSGGGNIVIESGWEEKEKVGRGMGMN